MYVFDYRVPVFARVILSTLEFFHAAQSRIVFIERPHVETLLTASEPFIFVEKIDTNRADSQLLRLTLVSLLENANDVER